MMHAVFRLHLFEIGQKPHDKIQLTKTVVFVTGFADAGIVEKSCATNPWRNCLWICHVFGRAQKAVVGSSRSIR
jgi:hypothetical protein